MENASQGERDFLTPSPEASITEEECPEQAGPLSITLDPSAPASGVSVTPNNQDNISSESDNESELTRVFLFTLVFYFIYVVCRKNLKQLPSTLKMNSL